MVILRCLWVQWALLTACEAAVWKFLAHDTSRVITDPDAMDKIRRDTEKTINKAAEMSPMEMLEEDLKLMASYLLPGRKPNFQERALELLVAFLCILWFVPFKRYFYVDDVAYEMRRDKEKQVMTQDDKQEKIQDDDEQINPIEKSHSDETGAGFFCAPEADVVIVFYNPACDKYSDNEALLPQGALRNSVVENAREGHLLQRTERYLGITQRSLSRKISHRVTNWFTAGTSSQEEEYDPSTEKTFAAVRAALLQDLYEVLPKLGFSVTIFSSIDRDELFLCITLRDEDKMRHALVRHGVELQIQAQIVAKLGVDQPPDEFESSPPYIKYDSRLPCQVLGDGAKDVEFYRLFDGPGSTKTIMNSTDRIRCINKTLNNLVNLDIAVNNKLIVAWFPAHTKDGLGKLEEDWANYSLIKDMTFVQPISLIREYFGSRVAFMFAWNGCYCKMVFALLPAAVIFELANVFAHWYGHNPYWNRRSLWGYGIVVAVWTRFASNCWKRAQEFLVSYWELKHVRKAGAKRPEFFGHYTTSPIDAKINIKVYPKWKFQLRQAASWLVTALFCLVNSLVLMLWIDAWHGRLNAAASIVLAILIQLFTQTFNWMAEAMTEAENHELQLTYYNSYLMKMFCFQFVNQYSAFFYIAVKQQFTRNGCPKIDIYDNDCIGLLNEQLPMTLVVLTLTRVVIVVIASLQVKIGIWWEDYSMRQQGLEKIPRSFLEEQGKFGPFRVREQVEAVVQMAMILGYIFMFGSVAPRIAFLCAIEFIVQLRSGAHLLTTAATRTLPRQSMGIGNVEHGVKYLGVVGMLFTGYLLVNYAPLFHGTKILTRVSALIFWGLFVYTLWFLVDLVFPPHSDSVDILEERRMHVKKKLSEAHSDAMYNEDSKDSPMLQDRAPGEYSKLVEDAEWNDIPRLADTSRRLDSSMSRLDSAEGSRNLDHLFK